MSHTATTSDFLWDELLQFIDEDRVIPVLGPRLLTLQHEGREVLLYRLLAERLAEALGVSADDLPEGGELNAVACRYLETGSKWQRLYSALKSVMPGEEELAIPEPMLQLADIRKFRLFVTTTFDPILERALARIRTGPDDTAEILAYSPDKRMDLARELDRQVRPVVFHILGRLSATPSYAVTQEDLLEYVHALQSAEQQPPLLFDELDQRNLLILGSGLSGWLAKFFLRATKRRRLRAVRDTTDYLADDRVADDADLVVFLRHFSSSVEIFEGGDAVGFVRELHERWRADHPEGESEDEASARGPSTRRPGFIFLSYAKEDRAAAEALKGALEAIGLEVFFDKEDLRYGEDFGDALKRAIRDCLLFIPLLSRHTLEDRRYFRREWSYAVDQALEITGTFIMPVVLDDVSPDDGLFPERFRDLHWASAPGGEPSREFVEQVKTEHREFQKRLVRAS